jgi:hypothetical protein
MGKLFGLILIVLVVWVGLEIYTKGFDGAFDGWLAWIDAPLNSHDRTGYHEGSKDGNDAPTAREGRGGSLAQRVGTKVQGEINDAAARRRETDNSDAEDND